ncbi:hypothetical protein ACIRRA_43315 [Nocardia sp. NPDC101769]|uniref:hypothetical protein n=1 Tax=Nocardia sp. NPDC101769 TaxID=3364333 RepID=UPI0037F5754D
MEYRLPESNTAPTKRHRSNTRVLLEALKWVRTGVNVYMLVVGEHETAASAIETITKAAVHLLHEN